MGTFANIKLGNGSLKIDSVDIGFLDEGSQFAFGYDTKEIEAGDSTSPILALRGVIPIRYICYFKTKPMEMTYTKAQQLLGLTASTVGDKKRINLGTVPTLNTVRVDFQHISPINGKTIDVVLWKTNIKPTFEASYSSDNAVSLSFEFRGIIDRDSHPSNPFGYIDFQQ